MGFKDWSVAPSRRHCLFRHRTEQRPAASPSAELALFHRCQRQSDLSDRLSYVVESAGSGSEVSAASVRLRPATSIFSRSTTTTSSGCGRGNKRAERRGPMARDPTRPTGSFDPIPTPAPDRGWPATASRNSTCRSLTRLTSSGCASAFGKRASGEFTSR